MFLHFYKIGNQPLGSEEWIVNSIFHLVITPISRLFLSEYLPPPANIDFFAYKFKNYLSLPNNIKLLDNEKVINHGRGKPCLSYK